MTEIFLFAILTIDVIVIYKGPSIYDVHTEGWSDSGGRILTGKGGSSPMWT